MKLSACLKNSEYLKSSGLSSNALSYYYFFIIAFILIFFQTLQVYFFWGLVRYVIIQSLVFVSIILLISLGKLKIRKTTNQQLFSIFLLWIVFLYCMLTNNWQENLLDTVILLEISILILLPYYIKKDLYKCLLNCFVYLNTISLFFWFLMLAGVPLPNTYAENMDYKFYNYYFFLFDTDYEFWIFPRYSGVFSEPGHVSMISAFFLYINRFKWNSFHTIVLLTVVLMSFSLAGYLLAFVSYVLHLILNFKEKKKIIIVVLLSLGFLGYTIYSFNDGDNVMNELILSRLEYDDGDIKGNNRESASFEGVYHWFLDRGNLLFGEGARILKKWNVEQTASWRDFFVRFGILGLILTGLLYILILSSNRSKAALGFLFIYFVSFLQRPHALYLYELVLFILAMTVIENSKKRI